MATVPIIKATNIYYFHTISPIGGIETFFYQLAKKYKDYDLTIVYRKADKAQLERLQKYVRCIQFFGQQFECEKAFFNFNTDIIENIKAKEYLLVIHGDYKAMKEQGQLSYVPQHPKINRYLAVSQRACKAFTELTGKKCELCYNPFEIDKPKKVLNLISATRLTREKGKQRMEKLAKELDDAGIPYLWTVFTNDTNAINNPNIIYMKPRLDITKYIANADYLVQLSDNEGYCYSVIEALSLGVPVIVTPCPVFEELGLENEKNCYFLPFDMKEIPTENIYKKIPKFLYQPKSDSWDKYLAKGNPTYLEDKNKKFLVTATNQYDELKKSDKELGRRPKKGEVWEVDYNRLQFLLGNNPSLATFVKVVEEKK